MPRSLFSSIVCLVLLAACGGGTGSKVHSGDPIYCRTNEAELSVAYDAYLASLQSGSEQQRLGALEQFLRLRSCVIVLEPTAR